MAKKKNPSASFTKGQTVKVTADNMHLYQQMGVREIYGVIEETLDDQCFIQLDPRAMLLVGDSWLHYCIHEETPPWVVPAKLEDIEVAKVRKFPLSLEESMDMVEERVGLLVYQLRNPIDESEFDDEEFEGDFDEDFDFDEATQEYEPWINAWAKEFAASKTVKQLPEPMRRDARMVAHSFLSFAWMFDLKQADDIDADTVRNLLLNIIPQKITAEPELFKHYGELLVLFFQFMEDEGHMFEVAELCMVADELHEEVYQRSQDTSGWDPSKAMMMQMVEQGIDPTDQAAVQRFIDEQNQQQ